MAERLVLWLSCALLSLGVFGLLTRRHAIAILLSIELILNAASLNFVAFAQRFGQVQGQATALFIIALAACEAAVGLAIVLALARTAKTTMADDVSLLKG
jgi:NADH-quinone oxidoreductase subunit K